VALSEADTCRKFVVPKLQAAGWDNEPHSIAEQRSITDGRIVPVGKGFVRKPQQRPDFLLRYERNFTLAVVEAKAAWKSAGEGLQQAKRYAEMLGLKFAYATNGHEIVEFDYFTGRESIIAAYPAPAELWARYRAGNKVADDSAARLLTPMNHSVGKGERYYQEIAVNRTVEGILSGPRRQLLTMATGTGKTAVAFQICWKLWNARWNRSWQTRGEHRHPKILYLADRNILVDQPKDGMFAPFGLARHKIEGGEAIKSREMYFAIYQALARDERRPGLYREYPPDFFDLVIVDECHRGSAREDSNWREILTYFEPAYQLGMTATPLRDDNRDTYLYFGNPIYEYSLRQGIEDGFLAPYRVHRVVTEWDAAGWRPSKDEQDRYGRAIPDDEYQTKDFERIVALRARTETLARHLTDFLKKTDRYAKTIVFCVDQEHAAEMRQELVNFNSDLVKQYPDYVCRVTADEGAIGLTHLAHFQDVDKPAPVILTTSQLLTTGVDAEMVKNVVLARVVGSRAEFKQIVGRGTRLKTDYGKEYFNIIDFTGTATRHFADPDFDGEPALIEEVTVDESGEQVSAAQTDPETPPEAQPVAYEMPQERIGPVAGSVLLNEPPPEPRKFYIDGGEVEVIGHLVYDLDTDGKKLQVVKYSEYSGRAVRTLYPNREAMQSAWADPDTRSEVLRELTERGISFEELAAGSDQPDADPFDLLCHLAWNAPLRTRRQRAEAARRQVQDLFGQYGETAREILALLLERYVERGILQFSALSELMKVQPFDRYGSPAEIATRHFGGVRGMKDAVSRLQSALYQ